MTPWKVEAFPAVEALLARQIGPVARFLIRRVAGQADGLDQLGELLLPHIPSDVGRVQFQHGLVELKHRLLASGTGAGLPAAPTLSGSAGSRSSSSNRSSASGSMAASPPANRMPATFDAAWADAMAVQLVALIGPIGRIVAKRALQQTDDKAAFLALLASHIDDPGERTRFLQQAYA